MRVAPVVLLLAACGSGHPVAATKGNGPLTDAGTAPVPVSNAPPPERGHLVNGLYYVEPGAPDALACQTDKDCIGDTVTDETGCCIRSPTPYPQTWAWHTWLSKRRRSSACTVTCPPLPVPTGPTQCATRTHCTAGICVNSCR